MFFTKEFLERKKTNRPKGFKEPEPEIDEEPEVINPRRSKRTGIKEAPSKKKTKKKKKKKKSKIEEEFVPAIGKEAYIGTQLHC